VDSLGGDFLRRTRVRQGVSQADLAQRVGSHQPQLSAWETGRKPITVTQLAVLLDALGLDLQLNAEPKHVQPGGGNTTPDRFAAVMGTQRGPARKRRKGR
jgi:transcriptional regulator with XRE-family HTH domain